jgi:predicted permease
VALLSHSLWRTAFGGRADAVGSKIVLDGEPYTVIGVMPQGFYFPSREARLWTNLRVAPMNFQQRDNTYLYGIGRLKDGVSPRQADAEMHTIGSAIARQYPDVLDRMTVAAIPYAEGVGRQSELTLNLLMSASLCVLLIACCNLANLAMARAMVRDRELAVRAALGAGRERLLRLMLTDSLLLAVAGGIAGFALGRAALPLLVKLIPVSLPIAEIPAPDWHVMLFAAAATLVTALACGALPALRSRNLNQSARTPGGAKRGVSRDVLVASQIAAAVVLLVTFGLLTRALLRVQNTDPGFRTANIMRLRTTLPLPKYEALATRDAYYQRVLREVRQLPGVTGAAWVSWVPMATKGGMWQVEIVGRPQKPADRQMASLRYVTPGYFSAIGIPLLAGRDVADGDDEKAPYVAVVSRSFAERYWPGESPVGRQIRYGNNERTIIGVAGDVRMRGPERKAEPQVYLSWRQPRGVFVGYYAPKDLVIRSSNNPMGLAGRLRRIIHDADPGLPVTDLEPMSHVVEAETAGRRVQVFVLGAFAIVAFLLAAIGIHGLLSFTVASRTQEIGIRMALGAKAGEIAAMMLGSGLRLALFGIAFGAATAWTAGRLLQSILAGVSPSDIATFTAAAVLALLMTIAGSLPPAIRAARLDPVQAIRAE